MLCFHFSSVQEIIIIIFLGLMAYEILIAWPGMKPMPPAVETESLSLKGSPLGFVKGMLLFHGL